MNTHTDINTVSSWYKTAGFYKTLVSLGFETILPFFRGKTLLEIGPADGAMTELLVKHFSRITLLEPSMRYTTMLKSRFPHAVITQGFIESFIPKETYDTIVMAHVLEHVSNPMSALGNLKKAMNKSSRLIIIVPNADSLHRYLGVAMELLPKRTALNAYDKKLGHKRVYTKTLLTEHIHKSGLKIIHTGGIFIKPLSNDQMKSWDSAIIRGLFSIGRKLPDLCSELYVVCRLKPS